MITIFNAVFYEPTYARISISKWNFDKERDDLVDVVVKKGDKVAGSATISKKKWISTAKQKESKIVKNPNEPMIYYYNDIIFDKPLTEEERLIKLSKECL